VYFIFPKNSLSVRVCGMGRAEKEEMKGGEGGGGTEGSREPRNRGKEEKAEKGRE